MVDTNELAHEIHRRRLANDTNARRCQAAGEATFCGMYNFTPTLEDFDSHMELAIDIGGKTLGVVSNLTPTYELIASATQAVDIFVFTVGERLAETEVIGWLPAARILDAPVVNTVRREAVVLVDGRCLFPMPEQIDFDRHTSFTEPDLNVPMVWDYNLQALWTPLGFHVYDGDARKRVRDADGENNG